MARLDEEGNLTDDDGNVLIWAPEGTKGKAEIEGLEFREDVTLAELAAFELESWQSTCAARDKRIEALEQEVASKAREIGDLEASCTTYKRDYATQVQLKGMANSRAVKAEQEVLRLGHKLDANRALVEKLAEDVILRDAAIEATRTELLKQVDDWKDDSAAWRAAWRAVGKIRDLAYAERDLWKEEAVRAGKQVVEGNKLREHQAQASYEAAKRWEDQHSEICAMHAEVATFKQEHAAQLAESTEIARLKLKHLSALGEWSRELTLAEAQIDHLEAQRAAWFSEISRLEKVVDRRLPEAS